MNADPAATPRNMANPSDAAGSGAASPVHQFEFVVGSDVLDGNHHVNNVAYVKWMQDAAIRHSDASGCTQMTDARGAIWVVRTHRIEYLRPAFAGDVVQVQTWVANFRKVLSLRKYRFLRASDKALLAQGETDWVFLDEKTGRPAAIPAEIRQAFHVAEEPEACSTGMVGAKIVR
jgi:acyl-CoA thioester hydrolase